MASLLERMNIDRPGGVNRNKKVKPDRSPYARPGSLPKGNVDGKWEHDMHGDTLKDRLSAPGTRNAPAPKFNMSRVVSAMNGATKTSSGSGDSLQIKGAGTVNTRNTLEISGLVEGTTAEDVKAIFQQHGPITQAKVVSTKGGDPIVRLSYKRPEDAAEAQKKYDGQNADGKTLSVKLIGSVASHLSARIANGPTVVDGSVDAFLDDVNDGGSKLRSDAILANDSRASVITTPAGQDPALYNQRREGRGGRGGGNRGRNGPNRRRGGRGGKKAGGMDVD